MPEPTRAPESLVLVPTQVEERLLEELGGLPEALGVQARCGFGPVAAAARTAQLVTALRPRRVLLLGIAGSLRLESAPLASARAFARVRLEGVGVGQGAGHLPAARMGFAQWDGAEAPVHDELPLAGGTEGELLTVCAASASPVEAEERRARHPAALAEDMEAFGVALACRLCAVPLVVVRGISNPAGERDPRAWRVRAALAAAREAALAWLLRTDWSPAP